MRSSSSSHSPGKLDIVKVCIVKIISCSYACMSIEVSVGEDGEGDTMQRCRDCPIKRATESVAQSEREGEEGISVGSALAYRNILCCRKK